MLSITGSGSAMIHSEAFERECSKDPFVSIAAPYFTAETRLGTKARRALGIGIVLWEVVCWNGKWDNAISHAGQIRMGENARGYPRFHSRWNRGSLLWIIELKKFGSGYICRDSFFKKLGINLFYRKVARRWSVSIVEKNNNSWKECGTCRGMQIVLFRNAHNVHDFIQRAGGVIWFIGGN